MSPPLERIARLIAERTGVRIDAERMGWVSTAVDRVVRSGAYPEGIEGLARAAEHGEAMDQLIDEVTVRETFFLRDVEQLESVDWPALHDEARASGRDTIHVWSAGCASGEEAYTLAMLARDALGEDPPVAVLGTDISVAALGCAREGRYAGRTVRRLHGGSLARHFAQEEGGVVVAPAVRRLVRFLRHNLVAEPPPSGGDGGFDLIVCRNVLIHLEPSPAERAGATLEAALHRRGTLVLGAADRLSLAGGALRERARLPRRPDAPRRVERRKVPGRPPPPPAGEGASAGSSPAAELAETVALADAGDLPRALAAAHRVNEQDPLNGSAHLLAGVLELSMSAPAMAVQSLRRALYLDPTLALAAFHLGRAHEELGEPVAASRAYDRALHAFDPEDPRDQWLLGQVDIADVAHACRLRLLALAHEGRPGREGAAPSSAETLGAGQQRSDVK